MSWVVIKPSLHDDSVQIRAMTPSSNLIVIQMKNGSVVGLGGCNGGGLKVPEFEDALAFHLAGVASALRDQPWMLDAVIDILGPEPFGGPLGLMRWIAALDLPRAA